MPQPAERVPYILESNEIMPASTDESTSKARRSACMPALGEGIVRKGRYRRVYSEERAAIVYALGAHFVARFTIENSGSRTST